MVRAAPDNKSVLQSSEPTTRWLPGLRSGHLCSRLNAQERGKPGAVFICHYLGLLVPRSLQHRRGTCDLGTACPSWTRLNCVVFQLTFYLEIISNLQRNCKNSTKNLQMPLTQTHPLVTLVTFPPSALSSIPRICAHTLSFSPQPLKSKYLKDIL